MKKQIYSAAALFLVSLVLTAAAHAAAGDVRGVRGYFQSVQPSGTTLAISATDLDVSNTGNAIRTPGTVTAGTVSTSNLNTTSLTVAGTTAFTGLISSTQLSANTDNWAPAGIISASIVQVSTDASRDLTGLTSGFSGRWLSLVNTGANNLVLKHNTTSTAANRFYGPNNQDVTLTPNSAVLLQYDSTVSRWRVVGAPSSSTGATVDVFDSSGTWNKPAGKAASSVVRVQAWGAGGSGGNASTGTPRVGGGGGGSYKEWWGTLADLSSSESVTVGSGGADVGNGNPSGGNNGGPSIFGSKVRAAGGTGGGSDNGGTNVCGGPAGGISDTTTAARTCTAVSWLNDYIEGWGGGSVTTVRGGYGYFTGGGGGGDNGAGGAGGISVWGGGGGAGRSSVGGASTNGGAGGAAGQPGNAPGGGGGAKTNGASSNTAGANGRVTVTVF